MPNIPQPYFLKDWRKTTLEFDRYAYDFGTKGDFLPLIWLDTQERNFKGPTFGLFTAIGDVREGAAINHGENHEALGAVGSLLGATLVGIDKSKQDGRNYVGMMRNYFNRENGWNVIMNFTNKGAHIGGGYGNDYWYEVYNNVLFYALGNYYPKEPGYSDIMHTIAEQFYQSSNVLGNNYSCSFFDFKTMQPGKNHVPPQEDVAAGYAFILYAAYVKFGDEKYLVAAQKALDALSSQKENRFYEALMPFGAYIGARLNAEKGAHYDVQKFLDWTFDGTATNREGWGVIVGNWGGYDVSGMVGSTIDRGGYGFAMNTFDLAWPLTATVRYDQRYARAVGKWMLNATNTARLFYPYDIPDSLQALPGKKAITKNVIAYEGLTKESGYPEHKGITPFAQGDGPQWAPGMPQETMFSCTVADTLVFLADSCSQPMWKKSFRSIAGPPICFAARMLFQPSSITILSPWQRALQSTSATSRWICMMPSAENFFYAMRRVLLTLIFQQTLHACWCWFQPEVVVW
jgi:hypothetical protein